MEPKYAPNVTILCSKCNKEIWTHTSPDTTLEQMKNAICSDCILKFKPRV